MKQLPSEVRSRTMRAVKSRDTTPEMIVRRLAHSMGKRFRLHRKDLPGTPDLTFPRLHKIILVHGCFWHGHDCKRGDRKPKTNQDYWIPKIDRNKQRDNENIKKLQLLGWTVMIVWECETKEIELLSSKIRNFLCPEDN